MPERREASLRAALRPRGSAVTKVRPGKGRRAKRGRRKEYKAVFLQSGIMTARELEAVEGMLFLKGPETRQRVEAASHVPSSKFQGLRDDAERFVAFVGTPDEASVEFWVPQVAHALGIVEVTMTFLVDVLLALGVLTRRPCGTYLWRGRETVWNRLRSATPLQLDQNLQESSDGAGVNQDLVEFCSCLLDVYRDSKEPVCLEYVRQEMVARRKIGDSTMMWHQLHCVNAVMTAAGIVQEIRCGSERRFMFPYLVREKYLRQDFPSSKRDEIPSPITQCTPIAARSQPRPVSQGNAPPPTADKRMMALKMILESVVRQITSSGSWLTGEPWFPLNERSLASTQAAIMEIVGSEICKVGVVDILGQGTLSAPTTQGVSGSNSVIALAVPQWMLLQRQGTSPSPQTSPSLSSTVSPSSVRASNSTQQQRSASFSRGVSSNQVSVDAALAQSVDVQVPNKTEHVETQPWSSVSSKLKEL